MHTNNFRESLGLVLEEIEQMLLAKNQAYGNSALDPLRVFSKASPEEQIRVRIDDKLSRLARGTDSGEDTELDLLGYLILLRIAKKKEEQAPFEYTGPYRFPPGNGVKYFCMRSSMIMRGLPNNIEFVGKEWSGTEVILTSPRHPSGVVVSKKDLPTMARVNPPIERPPIVIDKENN
jgi:hypothetical protein